MAMTGAHHLPDDQPGLRHSPPLHKHQQYIWSQDSGPNYSPLAKTLYQQK